MTQVRTGNPGTWFEVIGQVDRMNKFDDPTSGIAVRADGAKDSIVRTADIQPDVSNTLQRVTVSSRSCRFVRPWRIAVFRTSPNRTGRFGFFPLDDAFRFKIELSRLRHQPAFFTAREKVCGSRGSNFAFASAAVMPGACPGRTASNASLITSNSTLSTRYVRPGEVKKSPRHEMRPGMVIDG